MKDAISNAWGRLRSSDSRHIQIINAAFTVTLLVLIARAVIAAREIAIAWRFGIGAEVDAFQLALMVVTWVPLVLASVASLVFVPYLISLKDEEQRGRMMAEMLIVSVGLGLILSAFIFAFAAPVVGVLAGSFDAESRALTEEMVRQMAPAALFGTLAAFYVARLQAHGNLSFGLWEAAPALGLIGFLLLSPRESDMWAMAAGTVVGAAVQAIALAISARGYAPRLPRRWRGFRLAAWRPLFGTLGFLALSQVLLALANPIDLAFAAHWGTGGVAQLGYANRILGLCTAMGSIVLGRALLPILSARAAAGETDQGRGETLTWCYAMFALGVLVAVVVWITAPLIVAVLFERGAFTADDTTAVATLLRVGMLQLPLFLSGTVLVQWFSALQRYKVIMAACMLSFPVKVLANVMLTPLLGLEGIVLGTVAMYLTTTIVLISAWTRSQRNQRSVADFGSDK